jgi:hypothetical protein
VRFYKDKQGLPFIDLKELNEEAAMMLLQRGVESYEGGEDVTMLVQNAQGNYKGYNKQEVLKAKESQRGQALIGSPSKKDYRGMVSSNLISNCPFSKTNVTNVRAIFGPDLASVQGKTVWHILAPVVADYVAVPRSLVKTNKVVTLAADVFFVDRMAFLLPALQRIKFVMAEHVPVQTATSLSKHLKQVLKVVRAGFRIRTILMDGEFENIKPLMPTIECNTTAAKEHTSKAEQTIRTLKEQMQGLLATLPFSNLPKQMKIDFVYFMVLWLNAFPAKTKSLQYIPQGNY